MDELALLDWKRRVFALYAEVRAASDPESAWGTWRDVRDGLFHHHPQTPLPEQSRSGFTGLRYFDYQPALRVLARVAAAENQIREIGPVAVRQSAFATSLLPISSWRVLRRASSCTGSTPMVAASSCPSPTRQTGRKPMVAAVTCSTPSRAPTGRERRTARP